MKDFLEAIWEPGDVREIRAFDERGFISYGYFDSPEKAEKAAQALAPTHTVYITLNPCKPALLARAANRIRKSGKKDPQTSDADIAELRFVLVDCDPDRPAGISSTDTEKKEAENAARAIVAELGNPILAGDSGNGYHLIYRHTAKNKEQIKGFLQGLATRHNSTVKVDISVFNPARITKVLGTWARKGDNTPDRPHRQSRVLKIFSESVVLTFPEPAPIQVPKIAPMPKTESVVDVAGILAGHIKETIDEGSRTKYILTECVFNPDHKGKDAAVFQDRTGKTTYFCFHNSCQDKTWQDVKDALGIKKPEPTCNLCGKPGIWEEVAGKWHIKHDCTAKKPAEPAKQDELDKKIEVENKPGQEILFPLHIYPAIIQKWLLEIAESIQCPVDFAACTLLPVTATLIAGSRVEIKRDWHEAPSIYLAIAADTGSGKSPAQAKVMRLIYDQEKQYADRYNREKERFDEELAEWESAPKNIRGPKPETPGRDTIFSTDATVEALASILESNAGILLHQDEISGWVKSMGQYKSGKGADKEFFLSAWSGSPVKVDRKGKLPIFVEKPNLSISGAVVPENIRLLMPEERDGFLERILFCMPASYLRKWSSAEVSFDTWQGVQTLFAQVQPREFFLSNSALALFACWYDLLHCQAQEADGHLRGFFEKLIAYTARFAMILHALSGVGVSGEIPDTVMGNAIELAKYFLAHTSRAHKELYKSRETEQANAIIVWATRHQAKRVRTRHLVRAGIPGCTNSLSARDKMQELVNLELAIWTIPDREIEIQSVG